MSICQNERFPFLDFSPLSTFTVKTKSSFVSSLCRCRWNYLVGVLFVVFCLLNQFTGRVLFPIWFVIGHFSTYQTNPVLVVFLSSLSMYKLLIRVYFLRFHPVIQPEKREEEEKLMKTLLNIVLVWGVISSEITEIYETQEATKMKEGNHKRLRDLTEPESRESINFNDWVVLAKRD